MAKQTFTTGQVLSATQVNALQTNDFNQTVSPKTASYVLVAADVGTRITMNSASSTTITVNTGLFAAGDTLQITNIGAGVLTITAGTATVSTPGVLTLAQNASGSLYFTSTGVSIWQGSAAAAGAETWTTLASSALSGLSTITLSSITSKKLILHLVGGNVSLAGQDIMVRPNNNTTAANYKQIILQHGASGGPNLLSRNGSTNFFDCGTVDTTANNMLWFSIDNCTSTSLKIMQGVGGSNRVSGSPIASSNGSYGESAAITSITLLVTSGNFTAGTLNVYGAS